MLFIIFGWKTRTKEYGPTYPTECPHCTNDNYFHLLKARRWFSLFFIPLIPLTSASYDLVCPTCNASIALKSHAGAKQAKQLAARTDAYHNDSIHEGEYKRELQAFEADVFGAEGTVTIDSEHYNPKPAPGLRGLCALLFLFGVAGTVLLLRQLDPSGLLFAGFMIPYLALRYYDPHSATIPFTGAVQKFI